MEINERKLFIRFLKENKLYYLYFDTWEITKLQYIYCGFLNFKNIVKECKYNECSYSHLYREFKEIKELWKEQIS